MGSDADSDTKLVNHNEMNIVLLLQILHRMKGW